MNFTDIMNRATDTEITNAFGGANNYARIVNALPQEEKLERTKEMIGDALLSSLFVGFSPLGGLAGFGLGLGSKVPLVGRALKPLNGLYNASWKAQLGDAALTEGIPLYSHLNKQQSEINRIANLIEEQDKRVAEASKPYTNTNYNIQYQPIPSVDFNYQNVVDNIPPSTKVVTNNNNNTNNNGIILTKADVMGLANMLNKNAIQYNG